MFLSLKQSFSCFLSPPLKIVVAPPIYILGFHAPIGQDSVFLLQRVGFLLQRVESGCSDGPLILRILVIMNFVFATVSMYFIAARFTLTAASTPCLD